MPAKVNLRQGKSMFVKEVLNDNPLANAEAVNEVWCAARMLGNISAGLSTTCGSGSGCRGT
jgi:hypothetical protein